jgi:hypothetical protein
MSEWTHPMCDACWEDQNPDQTPFALAAEYRLIEQCCWCGLPTKGGIYVREDPKVPTFHVDHDP